MSDRDTGVEAVDFSPLESECSGNTLILFRTLHGVGFVYHLLISNDNNMDY